MPPAPTPLSNPAVDTGHLLAAHKRSTAGPIIGAAIVILMLAFGAFYFWGAHLNRESQPLPLIQGDASVE